MMDQAEKLRPVAPAEDAVARGRDGTPAEGRSAKEPPVTNDSRLADADGGSSKPAWIAAALVVALVAWMASGIVFPAEEDSPGEAARSQRAVERVTVQVTPSEARMVTRYLVSEGQALPERLTPVRSEAAGVVEAIAVEKGSYVERGTVIAELGAAERTAQKAQAEAELARRQRDFDAAQSLFERGYSTKARLDEARAALATAQAQLAAASETLENTVIVAPFSGVLDDLSIEPGEFVSSGKDVGMMVDVDPLIVEIEVPQQTVSKIKKGDSAEVSFITGERRDGTVRYVASNAKPSTRTFTVEIAVANEDRSIPAGVSARVRIPTGQTPAHFLSPAVLVLGPDGSLGAKVAGDDQTVKFFPVDMVRAETKGIWVSGLPEKARVITVGQGFVSEGETVNAVLAEDGGDDAIVDAVEAPEPPPEAEADPSFVETPKPVLTDEAGTESSSRNGPQTEATATAPAPVDPAGARPEAPSVETLALSLETVQKRLQDLDYEVGPADGVMGERTRAAIREFQRSNGLEVTGTPTAEFVAKLMQVLSQAGAGR